MMVKYSIVVKDECIACGACGAVAPEIFDFDDEGYAINVYAGDDNLGKSPIGEDLHDDLVDAVESCPTEAIKMSDAPFA